VNESCARAAHRRRPLTILQSYENRIMKSIRICVEWIFGEDRKQFAFVDNYKRLSIDQSAVGKIVIASFLLQNCRTCLYGSTVSRYFEILPPTLGEYFGRNDIVISDYAR
jgi:hypothetical protein